MKKKCLRLFLIWKNTFKCWTKLKTEKHIRTAEQLIRRNSIFCLKNQAFFSQSELTYRLDPRSLSPGSFLFAFWRSPPSFPPPSTSFHDFIIKRNKEAYDIKRRYKEKMERVHDNASVFMHLNIKRPSIKYIRLNKSNIWPLPSAVVRILTKEWRHRNNGHTLLLRPLSPVLSYDGPKITS